MSSGSPSATPPFKTSARNPLSPPSKSARRQKESPAFPPGIPQLAHISKLGLNSKIKKFSDSFICGKSYSPPLRGENSFLSTVQSPSKKRMLHKARARNARPYGYGGVMHSYFFLQHCRGAHRAPVIGICAKFRICSFPVQSKESPAFPPGIPYTHLGLITWQTPGRWPCRSPGSQPSRRRRYPRQRSGWR